MDGERHVCPVCGQSLESVVRRHKTLGVWVPVHSPGPCRNPECRASGRAAADRTRPRHRPRLWAKPGDEADAPPRATDG
ncbi:hypothetical protein ACIHEJ_33870 [Streptomyces sp. NPDC052301]|uniref:hypothetical protein n=1 Tax=Streptomyces sp. NPDC052301 TaxID=3365687 RepID=UPI0037D085C9